MNVIDAFAALADEPRWLAWREEERNGNRTKVPYAAHHDGPGNGYGKATDPATWGTHAEAAVRARDLDDGRKVGCGIALGDIGDDLYLAGTDLDSSLDENGALAPWAVRIISALATYAEISPSGRGLKAFFYVRAELVRPFLASVGVLADAWGCRRSIPGLDSAAHGPAVELYCAARYFTTTGRVWSTDHPRIVIVDQSQLDALAALVPPAGKPNHQPGGGRSATAFRLARKLIAAAASYEEMVAALERDPDTAEWTRTKGRAAGDRELKRLWQRAGKAPGGVPTIRVIKGERHLAADAGLDALMAAGIEFYIRGPDLARVALTPIKTANGNDQLLPGILRVSLAALARALGQAARWEKLNWKGEVVRIDPPAEVVEQIHAMTGEWPFSPLNGVITCPTLRPDGSLLTEPGYDAATALFLSDTLILPPMPQQPTRDDAVAALAFLNELLAEFPFVDDESRAVALSMLITPVVRAAVAPVAPLHLVKAPQPGTGKSYLANLASLIATGKPCAVIAVDKTLEETEKRLVGAILSGHPIISIDNARELLQGPILCQTIEQPLLELRRLGSSDMFEVANAVTVFANGNNLTIADDLVRRTVTCQLDANEENPETRTFRADPALMVQRHRSAYVAACLTIVRAYIDAGLPERLPSLPSFGAWSDRLRSALVWLDCPDPVLTMEAARDDDPVRQARAAVFRAWAEELGLNRGYQTAELVEAAEKDYSFNGAVVPTHPQLHAALIPVAAQRYRHPPKIDNVRLGIWLSRNVNTIAGKYKLLADRSDKQRIRWQLAAR